MTDLPLAQTVAEGADPGAAEATVTLDHEARILRRRRLVTDQGWAFLVDLERTTALAEGDVLALSDGRRVAVRAAAEPVLEVTGESLARLAWHIGNRHVPCQVLPDRLRIRRDPVIAHMLAHLGAALTEAEAPFLPEGGAYGHGRTHAQGHGAGAHAH
ncbi:MAG: urease accessory protein UreE [Rhodobacteraceae bacterium]|nr:urease accessory protein UreE [Paracoccaceae bacterium]